MYIAAHHNDVEQIIRLVAVYNKTKTKLNELKAKLIELGYVDGTNFNLGRIRDGQYLLLMPDVQTQSFIHFTVRARKVV